ncbi:UNVERIFIED_CONTAM: hypothetical protein PYX00_008345 [Menopon gallinae]|uniref:Nuclear envelope integral membrane protein 1 n=1 Tax=Menopon gallinae TaxID=328185 RepID=A0AAW2HN34_9NEOP
MIYHLISLLSLVVISGVSEGHELGAQYMSPGIPYRKGSSLQNTLSIYCYRGVPRRLVHIWQTVYISVSLQPEEYTLYHGSSPDVVYKKYEEHKSSWAGQFFTWKRKSIFLDPFSRSCVGIETANSYEVIINVIRIDFWKIILLICGICLFLAAPQLSSSPVFYYICGIALGISTSILITFYLISKLIPRKPAVFGFILGGWGVSFYLIHTLWNNIKNIALNYQREVLLYILVTGIISFIVCYRFGPVTDPRSKNLIKWALQVVALIAIFYSSAYQEMSVLCLLLLLLYYNFPASWTSSLLAFWKRRFPPKTKLLTEDEYHEQGARETVKALEELRKYCSSPECKQWKTVLSLREPVRFAQFVEGKSHLVDSEILEYESEARKAHYSLTDDEDSEAVYDDSD